CPATTRASGPLRPFKGWESWTSSGPGGCRPAWGTRDRPGRCRPLQPAPRKLEGSGGLLLAVAVVLLARAFQQGLAHAVDEQFELGLGDAEVRGEAQRVGAAVDDADAVLAHVLLGAVSAVALELRRQLAGEEQAGALHPG